MPTDRRPSFVRRAATAAALTLTVATGLLTGSGLAAAAPPTTTRVTNADLGTPAGDCNFAGPTGYCTELNGGGTAAVVDDRRAELGRGYLRLSTPSSSSHATVFAQQQFAGRRLSDLTTVAFESYIEQVGTTNAQIAPSINIQINPHRVGNTSTFTTLVWEPINAHLPVVPGTWQQWTPSATPSPGGWWATGTTNDVGTNRYGFTNYTATFADIKAALPDATIYQIGLNQGSGSTGLIAGVDRLRLNNTTYDFDNGPLVADVGLAISAPARAQRGSTTTVTVTVTNRGRLDTRNVDTAVVFSPGLRVVSAPGGFGFGSVAAYRTGQLAAGASVSFTITLAVDAKARGSVTAFGSVHSAVPDPYTLNNVAGASIAVSNRP